MPDYEVDVEAQPSNEGWLAGSVVVMAVESPSIFLGGRLRLFDQRGRQILDRRLDSFGQRSLGVGQGFRIPIRVRVPVDKNGRALSPRYSGYILCSDARGLERYKVPFGIPSHLSRRAILERLGRVLLHQGLLTPADAAVVLDGRDFNLRLAAGLDLLDRQYVPHLVVCLSQLHRAQHGPAEEAARERPEKITLVPSSAVSTLEEAAAVRPHLLRRDSKSLLVVTSWYHTRRAQLLFERQMMKDGIEVSAYPVEVPALPLATWWKSREGRVLIPLELLDLLWTRLRLALFGPPDLYFRLKQWLYPPPSPRPSAVDTAVPAAGTPFPRYVPPAADRATPSRLVPGLETSSRRVLVIEKESAVRNVVQGLLRSLGYETDHAADSREALARIGRQDYDSVLLDLRYGGEEAEEVIPAIHRIRPALVGRVLVITGEVADQRTLQMIDENFLVRITSDRVSRAVPDFLRALLHAHQKP